MAAALFFVFVLFWFRVLFFLLQIACLFICFCFLMFFFFFFLLQSVLDLLYFSSSLFFATNHICIVLSLSVCACIIICIILVCTFSVIVEIILYVSLFIYLSAHLSFGFLVLFALPVWGCIAGTTYRISKDLHDECDMYTKFPAICYWANSGNANYYT